MSHGHAFSEFGSLGRQNITNTSKLCVNTEGLPPMMSGYVASEGYAFHEFRPMARQKMKQIGQQALYQVKGPVRPQSGSSAVRFVHSPVRPRSD